MSPAGPRLAIYRPGARTTLSWRALRDAPIEPGNKEHLRLWIRNFIGPDLARRPVCEGHHAPLDIFAGIYFDRPSVAAILGPRGGGKSMIAALNTHLECRYNPTFGARIMGGSKQQSEQIYNAIDELVLAGYGRYGKDDETIEDLQRSKAYYRNGSTVAMLPASTKAARGPHVPKLCLDEIDEIKREIFSSAIGMAQADLRQGHHTNVLMTSTWHREDGLMGEKVEEGRAGKFPLYEFCVFEVLEYCPEERSGPELEHCPECPIQRWCHADIDGFGRGVPKAKRSNGHYSIETLIQKALVLGDGVIEADYLCRGPRSEGVWFRTYGEANEATDEMVERGISEFDPTYPVWLPIDYGVCTGSVAFQIRPRVISGYVCEDVHVFGEYYSDGVSAEDNAAHQKYLYEGLMHGRDINSCNVYMDPAGGHREPIGPTGINEYRRGGIKHIRFWPNMSGRKMESLRLIESFIHSGAGNRHLYIHPRCVMLRKAFRNYARKRVGDLFLPLPEDPQHPWEELIDSLAGGLLAKYPNGREDMKPRKHRVHIASIV